MQNGRKEIRSYILKGITAFCVIAASVFFYFIMLRLGKITSFIGKVVRILEPVTLGIVIAYLVNPIVNFFNSKLIPFFEKRFKKKEKAPVVANGISAIVAVLLLCAFLVSFTALVIPQFAESVSNIVKVLPETLTKWSIKGEKLVKRNVYLKSAYSNVIKYGEKWVETDLAEYASRLGTSVASGVLDVASFIKNLVIGVIVAVYLLLSKRTFINQTKKISYALFKDSTVDRLFRWTAETHKIFSGFINGKLIDSLIIGIICFIGTALLRIPYAVLVSCVIGVTNVIPVFGPWIGGIPCTILVLMINPIKGLYLGIFIILLQTLDGNIIGPKILGSKTGLSTFWVMFAIILGGGMFGVIGMLIGVPTFALIYRIVTTLINKKLSEKNKSTLSEDYALSNGDLEEISGGDEFEEG